MRKQTNILLAICFLALPLMALISTKGPAISAEKICTTAEECLPLAEKGDEKAQFALGLMYDSGEGAPKNPEEAVKWYRKAAGQGNVEAQLNLGVMYEHGDGIPQDYKEAFKWYDKAAKRGHPGAQLKLGRMYEQGKGVPQDYDETIKWYRRAAQQASADANFYLGFMYYEGEDVVKNLVKNFGWLGVILLIILSGLGGYTVRLRQKIKDLEDRLARKITKEQNRIKELEAILEENIDESSQ